MLWIGLVLSSGSCCSSGSALRACVMGTDGCSSSGSSFRFFGSSGRFPGPRRPLGAASDGSIGLKALLARGAIELL